jgi:hypothetical protein
MIEYIIAFLIVGYLIFIIVGLILVTYGMFNLSSHTVPKTIKDAVLTQYIKDKKTVEEGARQLAAINAKPINTTYTAEMQKKEIDVANAKKVIAGYTDTMQTEELSALPDIEIQEPTGKEIITLSKNNIMVGRVTLISIWVLIIIGLMFLMIALF